MPQVPKQRNYMNTLLSNWFPDLGHKKSQHLKKMLAFYILRSLSDLSDHLHHVHDHEKAHPE